MYFCLGLSNPKSSVNVGQILRAASCYEAAMIAISGKRYKGSSTDTLSTHTRIPLLRTDDLHSVIPFDCVPVAVDLIEGATSLIDYEHPQRAFYIFGAEDATLGNKVTSWCRDKIYIPTQHCMNLAATVNVVLYDRMCKLNK